jgi:hypothetical protein
MRATHSAKAAPLHASRSADAVQLQLLHAPRVASATPETGFRPFAAQSAWVPQLALGSPLGSGFPTGLWVPQLALGSPLGSGFPGAWGIEFPERLGTELRAHLLS